MPNRHPIIQLFATRPADRQKDPNPWFCRLCRVHLSLTTRGYRATFCHFQTWEHLLKDQRYRFWNPGLTVYSKSGRPLIGVELELAKKSFLSVAEVPQLAPKNLRVGQTEISLIPWSQTGRDILSSQIFHANKWLSDGRVLYTIIKLWSHSGVITQHNDYCSNFCWEPGLVGQFHALFDLILPNLTVLGHGSLELVHSGALTFI